MRTHKLIFLCLSLGFLGVSCQSQPSSEPQAATAQVVQAVVPEASVEAAQQLVWAQRYEDATQMLDTVLQNQPNNLQAMELRAISLAKTGFVTRSLNDFIAITQIQPSERSFFNLGNALQQMGFCERAVDGYRRALELNPNNYQALANMGAAYVCYGKNDEGLAALNQALVANPSNEIVLTNLGIAYFEKSDFDNALTYLNRATQSNDAYAPAHFALFRLYIKQNSMEMAKQHLRRFAQLMPKSRKVASEEKLLR